MGVRSSEKSPNSVTGTFEAERDWWPESVIDTLIGTSSFFETRQCRNPQFIHLLPYFIYPPA